MMFRNTVVLGASLAAMLPAVASAQNNPPASSPWSGLSTSGAYAGASIGRAKLHAPCPGGFSCDLRDGSWRVYGGAKFNNILGGEVGLMDLGDWTRGGGHTTARGIDAKLTAGWPIGENSSIFGKLGVAYLRTNVSGAGLAGGSDDKWGPTYGVGAQVGINKNWAIRGDIDRYRVRLPDGRDNVDTYMIGAQYTFR